MDVKNLEVCYDCGNKYSTTDSVSTFNIGNCCKCGEVKSVTNIRNYNYLLMFEKALFFGQYIFQTDILCDTKTESKETLSTIEISPTTYLELKNVNNLDEKTIKFLNDSILGEVLSIYFVGLNGFIHCRINNEKCVINLIPNHIDYLRLNGYAVPYLFDLEKLQEFEWFKFKI